LEVEYLKYISRRQNRFLYPDELKDLFDLEYPSSYPLDPFFIRDFSFPCYGHGAFFTDGAWWLRYWTALDQDHYLMHPCAIQFYTDPRLNYLGGDTILIDCEMVDQVKFEYQCFNSKCFFGNQSLALAMRNKRKKKSAIEGFFQPHCYQMDLELSGVESYLRMSDNEFIILDTFRLNFTALVVDNSPPRLVLQDCDTCQTTVQVLSADCDSSWVDGPNIQVLSDSITQYIWTAFDRCGNTSTLSLNWNTRRDLQVWFEDQDGDGYGSEDSLSWRGDVPGYSNVPGDCHDQDATIYPGAPENPSDNLDNDCSGSGNVEVCDVSDELAILPECTPTSYMLNPSTLEENSTSNSCLDIFPNFHGDIWFTCVVTNAAAINIELISDFSTSLNLYRGTCANLQSLECVSYDSGLEAEDLVPGERIYIQVALDNQVSGPFGICASAPNVTSTSTRGDFQQFTVFPNPSPGPVTLEILDRNIKKGSIGIYSIFGQRMKIIYHHTPLNEQGIELDISDLPSGAYWLVFQNKNHHWVSKVVKI